MGKLINEFKDFAIKGNVMDMAIGVVLGAAFGKIVSSFVSDIIMPLIGLLVGGVDFTQWKWVLSPANEALGKAEVALTYGNFIQVIFDFLIIAWCIFLVVKAINKAKKPKEEPAPEPPATPEDIVLLREIRDSLKK
ncbi:MAG: large-conductance mechanosensitive channel protein MscL [Bacteroidales bacterium]|nr:large-conductance mechanosensitive channel protein MscL [Bacteroidales bacterium]